MSTPKKYGTEFLINTTVADGQSEPHVTALADGRFVAVWTDNSSSGSSVDDTSSYAVRGQIFNADGTKAGAEFLVNTTTLADQWAPSVTALKNGGFVVSWTDGSNSADDSEGYAIRGQIFGGNGSKQGAEFLVNTETASSQYSSNIKMLSDGRFVVVWASLSGSGGDEGEAIHGQIFNADGSKAGAEFLVNTTTANSQQLPVVTSLPNGRFLVAWSDQSRSNGDLSEGSVRAQIFNADGSKSGNEFLLNTTTDGLQSNPSVTGLTGGRFVAVWTNDGTDQDVRAQVFNADGSKSGAEFAVNTTTQGDQSEASVTALANGRFMVAWRDGSQTGGDTSVLAIRAQVFNADGTRSGDEFLVNTTVQNNQYQVKLTTLADGRVVLGWTDNSWSGGDTNGTAVRGQIVDPRIAAVNLAGTTLNDQFVGTRFADTMKGQAGKDLILGAAGADKIQGGAGQDRLLGGAGRDQLSGGKGADRLIGGTGQDVLTGGAGNDHFSFAKAGQANGDRITDFVRGDKIDLSAFMDGGKFIGAAAFKPAGTQAEVRYDKATGRLQGDVDGNGTVDWSLTIANKAALVAVDFLF